MTFKVTKLMPNEKAVECINTLLKDLRIEDPILREQELLKIMHKSTWFRNTDGTITLDRNIKEFGLPKALRAIHMFDVPIKVKEVHRGNIMTVGFGEFAEKGRVDKYFICRKDDLICQHPSPILVFWPENESEPKISNFASLV